MNEKGIVVLNSHGGSSCVVRGNIRNRRMSYKGSFPKRFIRLVDTPACLVIHHKVWCETGYGAKTTRVLHRWAVKSVLRRVGMR